MSNWTKGVGEFQINRIKNAFLKKSKAGNGLVVLSVDMEGQTMYWQGTLTGNMAAIVASTLARLSYQESSLLPIADPNKNISDLFPAFPEGKVTGTIEAERYTVEDEETGEEEEREVYKLKWINVEGFHGGDSGLSLEDATKEASIFELSGDLLKFQEDTKAKNLKEAMDKPKPAPMMQKPKEEAKDPETGTALDNLPF